MAKTLNDYSELEKLTVSDEELNAVIAVTVDELLEHMAQAGRDISERWAEREPEAAARLEQWRLDNPEAETARQRAGTEIHREAAEVVTKLFSNRLRAKREAFQLAAQGAPSVGHEASGPSTTTGTEQSIEL